MSAKLLNRANGLFGTFRPTIERVVAFAG